MNKTVSKIVLMASIILAMALTFSCYNTHTADNEKRILGTWVTVEKNGDGGIWVFNSDGTGSGGSRERTYKEFKYAVVSSKLAIVVERDFTIVFDLFISNDGKTTILYSGNYGDYLLRKKN